MKSRTCLATLLTAVILLGLGCKTTIINPDAENQATYQMGKLRLEEPKGIDAVYAATEKAMSDLGLKVVQRTKDALQAEVIARDAQDKKIIVKLLSITKDTTKVTVNVSPMEKAQRIYESIHENLGM